MFREAQLVCSLIRHIFIKYCEVNKRLRIIVVPSGEYEKRLRLDYFRRFNNVMLWMVGFILLSFLGLEIHCLHLSLPDYSFLGSSCLNPSCLISLARLAGSPIDIAVKRLHGNIRVSSHRRLITMK
jgi:hypothetical protein